MDALAGLTFRQPELLWLLAAAPLAALFLWTREHIRRSRAQRFASERLRGVWNQARWLRPLFLMLGLIGATLALAGPRYGFTLRTVEEPESNRVILLDSSHSMAAEDVGTSRLDAAVAIAKRLVESEPGRVALILFEGEAEVVSPLTSDHAAVQTLLESLSAGEAAEAGSDMAVALKKAIELVPGGAAGSTDVILISDGEHRGGDFERVLEEVAAAGLRVSTVLVGSDEGSTIPIGEGRFLRDEDGQMVISRADAANLRRIAQRTGGQFFDNPFGQITLRRLTSGVEFDGSRKSGRTARVPVEHYQWPLGFALAMFLCGSLAHRGAEC
jgi:Ca-activated chloride channel family protein